MVVTHHEYGISALISQTSFGGETSGRVAKCRLFSQAMLHQKMITPKPEVVAGALQIQYPETVDSEAMRVSAIICFSKIPLVGQKYRE